MNEVVIKTVRGCVPWSSRAAGSNSTAEALASWRNMPQKAGADAALSVVPLLQQADAPPPLCSIIKGSHGVTKLPLFLYNIPGRSVINIPVETVVRTRRDFARRS